MAVVDEQRRRAFRARLHFFVEAERADADGTDQFAQTWPQFAADALPHGGCQGFQMPKLSPADDDPDRPEALRIVPFPAQAVQQRGLAGTGGTGDEDCAAGGRIQLPGPVPLGGAVDAGSDEVQLALPADGTYRRLR